MSSAQHDWDGDRADAPGRTWRRIDVPVAGSVVALAVDPAGRRLAVGDQEGVSLRRLDGGDAWTGGTSGWQRMALSGAVVDLRFAPAGDLWVATTRGLWHIDADGRRRDRSPGTSEAARAVHRVAVGGGFVVAATEGGLFAAHGEETWLRVTQGLPHAPMTAVAVRARAATSGAGARADVWVVSAQRLHRLVLRRGGPVLEASVAERVDVAGWPAGQPAADIATDVAGDAVVVLFSRALARSMDGEWGRPHWEIVYPAWPPGAGAFRLAAGGPAGVWLATDQGLLAATGWPARWQRAPSPAGNTPAYAVAVARGVVYAAGPSGLLVGEPRAAASARPMRLAGTRPGATTMEPGPGTVRVVPAPTPDPDLRAVHAKALERAGLEPARFRTLRHRLSARGWMPELDIQVGADYDVDSKEDYDESFSHGELRELNDRFDGRSQGLEGRVTLSWDLGDVVYHPDQMDLSRESRQVITLRDTILDEINQLYFDRRRALTALARYADRSDPEAVELAVRCRELAAGLDAWTGGWFSEQLEARRAASVYGSD